MKDALAAAPGGGLDYYSYEPFQIYGAGAVSQMAWVSSVGDLWRSSNDIRPSWKSILENAYLTNTWAPNMKPGRYNDADELEIGNGHLTIAEERSHFALWCLMKSPLIIGTGVRVLPAASLAILLNKRLIAIDQDPLAIQGTLRAAFESSGARAPSIAVQPVPCLTDPTLCPQKSPWVTHCSFGSPTAAAQRWVIQDLPSSRGEGQRVMQPSTKLCLARSSLSEKHSYSSVDIVACDPKSITQAWDIGGANVTIAQIRDATNASSCLTFNSSSLHMKSCGVEMGDKKTPNESGCQPLQVWAGPLAGGDVVVLLLNIGNETKSITAEWADIGLKHGVRVNAKDLWTGKVVGGGNPFTGSISASVATHDSAVFRLSAVL
jgi:hypothetical protein